MPLIKSKSKKAFEHNLKAELTAGKPKDQSLAISYNMQRQAGKKKKASGGTVVSGSKDMNYADGGESHSKYMSDIAQNHQRMEGVHIQVEGKVQVPLV